MAAKIFNEYNRNWHKRSMDDILEALKDGQEQYTHYFYGKVTNKLLDYEMRQALRTLEHDGLIVLIPIMKTIHKWKITDAGIEYLKNLEHPPAEVNIL